MPYALNVIAVGSEAPLSLAAGQLVAEPDDPPAAVLEIGEIVARGVRYLIQMDDGTGYMTGMGLVDVPSDSNEPAKLSLPVSVGEDLDALLSELIQDSPMHRLVVYLEANRIISRPGVDEEHPARPQLFAALSLQEWMDAAVGGRIAEEHVFVVDAGKSTSMNNT